jgi:hypothetical protein
VSTHQVCIVKAWHVPTTQRENRSFVQFGNFYAKFIRHFRDILPPLTDLMRKSQPHKVTLTPTYLKAFETLTLRLISAPCPILPEVN